MRIIAGILGGRNFDSPHSHRTHPMGEKMRGAMFNVLGDISGLSVLDAYGGSGALAFEAMSRGASNALIIEVEKSAAECIEKNIALLGLEQTVRLIRANAASWSERNHTTKFDIVLCDPPYDAIKISQLDKLARHVATGGLFILSMPTDTEAPDFEGFELHAEKSYGDGSLVFYKNF